MKPFKAGAKVSWQWLGRAIHGKVKNVYFETVTKTIKGKKIKRIGSKAKPAYLVEADSGNIALKLHTELSAASSTSKAKKLKPPSLFS